jgi:glycosyltransferase involved in cell wall biosynthesis
MIVEPKVSCICITHNRIGMLRRAIQCFQSQSYGNKELVILFENDPVTEKYAENNFTYSYYELVEEPAPVPHYPEGDRFIKRPVREVPTGKVVFYKVITMQKMTLGMKRNLSIRAASGEYICVWDDDDWYAENRIRNQMKFLQFTGKLACSLAYTIFFDSNTEKAYYNLHRVTGHENTLLFRKGEFTLYDNLNTGEDTPLLLHFYRENQLSVMDEPALYIYCFHNSNSCPSAHFTIIINTSTLLDEGYAQDVRKLLNR